MLALAEHLKLNPHSRVAALSRGDIGWLDWTPTTEAVANLFDLATGVVASLGKTKLQPEHAYPRPGNAAPAEPEPAAPTIAEFSVGALMKFMYG